MYGKEIKLKTNIYWLTGKQKGNLMSLSINPNTAKQKTVGFRGKDADSKELQKSALIGAALGAGAGTIFAIAVPKQGALKKEQFNGEEARKSFINTLLSDYSQMAKESEVLTGGQRRNAKRAIKDRNKTVFSIKNLPEVKAFIEILTPLRSAEKKVRSARPDYLVEAEEKLLKARTEEEIAAAKEKVNLNLERAKSEKPLFAEAIKERDEIKQRIKPPQGWDKTKQVILTEEQRAFLEAKEKASMAAKKACQESRVAAAKTLKEGIKYSKIKCAIGGAAIGAAVALYRTINSNAKTNGIAGAKPLDIIS